MSYSVVIPSRNASNIDACVDALRTAGEACPVIVVDNGLDCWRSDCKYIDYPSERFVYSNAINIGVKATGLDDVIVCGDDTRLLTPHGFRQLADISRKHDGNIILSAGITGAVGNANQLNTGRNEMRWENTILCFVAVYIPRKIFIHAGPMDERYRADYGCEDGDFCFAARRLGYRLAVYDGVVVEHGVLPSEYRKYGNLSFSQNAALFEQKWQVPYGS